jgi:hypothetical protein
MRNNVLAQAAAVATLVLAAAPTPASATRTGMALAICISRGTDCSITNKGDDYEICVKNTDGKQCVTCPNLAQDKQTCSVAKTKEDGVKPEAGLAALLAGEYTASPPKEQSSQKAAKP